MLIRSTLSLDWIELLQELNLKKKKKKLNYFRFNVFRSIDSSYLSRNIDHSYMIIIISLF